MPSSEVWSAAIGELWSATGEVQGATDDSEPEAEEAGEVAISLWHSAICKGLAGSLGAKKAHAQTESIQHMT